MFATNTTNNNFVPLESIKFDRMKKWKYYKTYQNYDRIIRLVSNKHRSTVQYLFNNNLFYIYFKNNPLVWNLIFEKIGFTKTKASKIKLSQL